MDPGRGGASMAVDTRAVPWHEARMRAHVVGSPLPASAVPLPEALGRVLAEPLVATRPLPGFDSAAMDGYAVRGNPPWMVQGRTLAGDPLPRPLAAGHAHEIATGALVPPGTDAVIPYENARRCGELLTGYLAAPNIRRAGEEARAGDEVMPGSALITPQRLALAAALGYDDLVVVRQPRVAALITGDELIRHGVPLPGRLRDAIGPALAGLVRAAGGHLVSTSYMSDDREPLLDALATATADLVVVSGSSSAGRADHLSANLEALGAEPVVNGVGCRPGHTQSLWRTSDGLIVVGLPGNPFAAVAAFLTLVAPCIAGLLGTELRALHRVPLGVLRQHPSTTRLTPVSLDAGQLEPIRYDGSAMLRGLALADALAVVPPASDPQARAELLPLPGCADCA
jgi:molybdopterin molybdotransferase